MGCIKGEGPYFDEEPYLCHNQSDNPNQEPPSIQHPPNLNQDLKNNILFSTVN